MSSKICWKCAEKAITQEETLSNEMSFIVACVWTEACTSERWARSLYQEKGELTFVPGKERKEKGEKREYQESFNRRRRMKAESRQIPQKLAARLKFVYSLYQLHEESQRFTDKTNKQPNDEAPIPTRPFQDLVSIVFDCRSKWEVRIFSILCGQFVCVLIYQTNKVIFKESRERSNIFRLWTGKL